MIIKKLPVSAFIRVPLIRTLINADKKISESAHQDAGLDTSVRRNLQGF